MIRRWALFESALAERGLWRSAVHAATASTPAQPPAAHRAWAALRRRQRRDRAQARQPGRRPGDRQAWRKFRVQAHYLRHRGFVRSGDLDRAVRTLAQCGVPVDWVHGRFDAVCPPANSRRWASVGGRLLLPPSGHLGHEPGMMTALRSVVRGGT